MEGGGHGGVPESEASRRRVKRPPKDDQIRSPKTLIQSPLPVNFTYGPFFFLIIQLSKSQIKTTRLIILINHRFNVDCISLYIPFQIRRQIKNKTETIQVNTFQFIFNDFILFFYKYVYIPKLYNRTIKSNQNFQ